MERNICCPPNTPRLCFPNHSLEKKMLSQTSSVDFGGSNYLVLFRRSFPLFRVLAYAVPHKLQSAINFGRPAHRGKAIERFWKLHLRIYSGLIPQYVVELMAINCHLHHHQVFIKLLDWLETCESFFLFARTIMLCDNHNSVIFPNFAKDNIHTEFLHLSILWKEFRPPPPAPRHFKTNDHTCSQKQHK